MPSTNMLDDVANDLAIWIDQISTDIAVAFAASHSPFSAHVTEEQKLEFYKAKLFNPDGSPNAAGRDEEMARVGPEQFGQVLKAVVKRWPELLQPPAAPPVPPGAPPVPPAGLPPVPGGLGPPLPGPLVGGPPVPPPPPMMPPPMAGPQPQVRS